MIQLALFALTVLSTFFVGGIYYSLSIMSILLAHEMGHYLTSRKYGIPATLPYFIPFPFSPFGTFGAIIKMKGIILNKKALFDIGVAGPLSGFIVAIPFMLYGISLSRIETVSEKAAYLRLGDPLIFKIFIKILLGEVPKDCDIVLHPFAYAGWVGLFVTSLNLLPLGQLDGGHVAYAVFGEKTRYVYGFVFVMLGVLAVLYNPGWIGLLFLLLIFGLRHPRPFDIESGIGQKRKWLALLMLGIFALSFTPSPFPSLKF